MLSKELLNKDIMLLQQSVASQKVDRFIRRLQIVKMNAKVFEQMRSEMLEKSRPR